ncbi:MAG: WYL domain-containing transcriptional regulator, partial [Betaproteobacteria bacterium]|nr:WYL domain-containing transcriptional regulator [Betaproteobacteria bacterium]
MKGRNAQVARILTILDLLDGASTSGLSVSEIHDRIAERGHEASKRTVYRDLEALAQAGFPLFPEGEGESESRWRLDRTTRIHEYLVLTARELFALFLARGALKPLEHTPFYQDLEGIFDKLEERLGKKQLQYLESLDAELKFEPGPAWGLALNPELLETLRAACSEGHVVRAVYFSVNSQKESERNLGPHYLYYAKGGLYLVAEDLADQKVKIFAIPRFKSAEMTETAYEGRVVTPEELFTGAMNVYNGAKPEEIVIEFDESASQYVRERRWHSSQRIIALDQGRIRMQLEVGSSPELVAWILSFGPTARVISPPELADRVAEKAMETAKAYGKAKP